MYEFLPAFLALDFLELELDGCELPCGCWELNSGPLVEQYALLTAEILLPTLFCFLFEKGSHCVALFSSETSLTRLTLNLGCLPLPSAGIEDVYHLSQLFVESVSCYVAQAAPYLVITVLLGFEITSVLSYHA